MGYLRSLKNSACSISIRVTMYAYLPGGVSWRARV